MMKIFLTKENKILGLAVVLLFQIQMSTAQFLGPLPTPTYAGDSVSFSNSTTLGTTYIWTLESTPVDFSLSSVPEFDEVAGAGSGFNTPVFVHTVKDDDDQWYSFVSNYHGNFISKLTYGSSPLNEPSIETMAYFGSKGWLEGVEVMKDTAGVWYGFTVNHNKLYRWNFEDNKLSGALTNVDSMDFYDILSWAHQLNIQWFPEKGKYIGFAINRNSTKGVTRLDFGNSLSNTPETTMISSPAGTSDHCNFALIQDGKSWYMFITNLTTHNLTRYDFGTDIENNSPEKVNLGNPTGQFNLPRGILMFPNCNENQLIGYLSNENGDFFKMDFDGDITSEPSVSLIGNIGMGRNALNTFIFEDHIYLLLQSTSGYIHRAPLFSFPDPKIVKYEDAEIQYAYADTGTYTVALYTNPGHLMGSSAGCKTFDVMHRQNDNTGIEDLNSDNQYLKVYPNPFSDQLMIQLSFPEQLNDLLSLTIFDIYGRQVYQNTAIQNTDQLIEVDARKWSSGVYHYILQVENKMMASGKIVKSN